MSILPSLHGKVCLVTGAARGIGRGIALQLGGAGATVYITGRTTANLNDCAKEIKERGGSPIPVTMDHGNDDDVKKLFEKIKKDQDGRLDLLVNNAYAGTKTMLSNSDKRFWEMDPVNTWDMITRVGLRGHYICATLASRLMVQRRSGLIINVSSSGNTTSDSSDGLFVFNVAYGVAKTGSDKMAADCAQELRKSNVAMISLWPGPTKTEAMEDQQSKIFEKAESLEFAGKACVFLAAEQKVMARTGKIVKTVDVAREYGFKDIDGSTPVDFRQVNNLVDFVGYPRVAAYIPDFVRIPYWLVHFRSYQF